MSRLAETGTFLGRVPFVRFAGPDPVLVLPGGQAFVQRQTPARIARDARRIARILPRDRGFIMLGYDVAQHDPAAGLARDVGAIIDQLGGPVALLGISYGGLVALRAASEAPIAKLVLLASAYDFSPEGHARVRHQIECAERGDLVGLTEGFTRVFRRPWLDWLVRWRVHASRDRLAHTLNEPATIVRGLRAVVDHPLDPSRLARITAPCLIVGGSADQFFGAGMQEATARLLPRASLDIVAGETHMLPVERAGRVARSLRRFLADGR